MTEQEFNKKYYRENVAIHLPTIDLYNEFAELASKFGHMFACEISYMNNNTWYAFQEEYCVNLYDGYYGDLDIYENKKYKIIQFKSSKEEKNIIPKEILLEKNGSIKVVECRDGDKYMLVGDVFYDKSSVFMTYDYTDDLISSYNATCDIYKIFEMHARENTCWTFENQDDKLLDLIWERKEKFEFSECELFIMKSISSKYSYIGKDEEGNLYVDAPLMPKMPINRCINIINYEGFPFINLLKNINLFFEQIPSDNRTLIRIDKYVKRW